MCSKKHGRLQNFCKWGQLSLNNFQHKRRKPPSPMKKMATKRRKRLSTWRKGPSKGEKAPYMNLFFEWGGRAPYTHSSPWSPMSKSDNKMNNIIRNYSSHNYIKIHSRMHPIALFHKIFPEEHAL